MPFIAALALVAATAAPREVTILDLVEIELGYTTIAEQYYRKLNPQQLLDGARSGIVAYLRERGIAQPQVGFPRARPDGRGVVPAIDQLVGRAIVRYGARVEPRAIAYATVRGELSALHDPYSSFFTKAQLDAFSRALNGETFAGTGLVVHVDAAAKAWHVDDVFDGGPAATAGMLAGDAIVAVDGMPVDATNADAPAATLRGKAGTVVRLSIVRDGVALPEPVLVTRAPVTPPEVTSRLLPDGVGYVALRSFGATADKEVRAAFERLAARGAKAFVFDLRGNGGGYESTAIGVASLFVPPGPVMSEEARHGHRVTLQTKGAPLPHAPLAVIVDGNSASGSEIVAAAIQDRHAGTLVGARTYGKGLVQTIVPLPDGAAVKLTTARYYTAAGRDIDNVGVTPDIDVRAPGGPVGVPGKDAQLDRAIAALR